MGSWCIFFFGGRSIEAIILAGGLGKRLRKVISDVPKPMAIVNGKPFLEWILLYLKNYDFNRIILAVGYKKEIIKNYFKDKFLNMDIIYSEETEQLGTGGAIKKALKFANENRVFILNGDTFFNVDLREMKKIDADVVIAVKKLKNFSRYGRILTDKNNSIVKFEEKKFCKEGFINGGIYLIKRNIFQKVKEKIFSFEKFLEKNPNINMKIYESNSLFIDIGIPEDYQKANLIIKEVYGNYSNTF